MQDPTEFLRQQNQKLLSQLQHRQERFQTILDRSSVVSGGAATTTFTRPQRNARGPSTRLESASVARNKLNSRHKASKENLSQDKKTSRLDQNACREFSRQGQGHRLYHRVTEFDDARPVLLDTPLEGSPPHRGQPEVFRDRSNGQYHVNVDSNEIEQLEENQIRNGSFDGSKLSSGSGRTSTPKRSTQPMNETPPRSILKRRELIDNNIRVESKYDHTPTAAVTPKHKTNLNFSYTNEGSPENSFHTPTSTQSRPQYMTPTDGSYIEEYPETMTKSSRARDHQQQADSRADQVKEVEVMMQERLLLDTGNDREHAGIVRHLSQRPKSVIFETEDVPKCDDKSADAVKASIKPSSDPCYEARPQAIRTALFTGSQYGRPLLGYDWIAGLLDNEGSQVNKPEEFYEEMKEFRRNNKEACISTSRPWNPLNLTRPISPEIQDPGHTCIHGYHVNDRLYPKPMNADEEGRSVCPVCLIPRKQPTAESPGFVRVSIPRSTLLSPYRVKPHRRRSFDSSDTYALSQHCLAGWECSQPSMLPTAATVDLKQAVNGLQTKLTTTMDEAERSANMFSQTGRLFGNSRATNDLLNTSHALYFDQQKRMKDRA